MVRRQELREFMAGMGGTFIATGVMVGLGFNSGAALAGIGFVLIYKGWRYGQ